MSNTPEPQQRDGHDQKQAQPGAPERDNSGPGQERPESEDIDESDDIERPQ